MPKKKQLRPASKPKQSSITEADDVVAGSLPKKQQLRPASKPKQSSITEADDVVAGWLSTRRTMPTSLTSPGKKKTSPGKKKAKKTYDLSSDSDFSSGSSDNEADHCLTSSFEVETEAEAKNEAKRMLVNPEVAFVSTVTPTGGSNEREELYTATPVGLTGETILTAEATNKLTDVSRITSILQQTCGVNRPPLLITYKWIPKQGAVTEKHVIEQMTLLGKTEITTDIVKSHVEDIKTLREAIKSVTLSKFHQQVTYRAQEFGLQYRNRLVMSFQDVGLWWGSLTEDEAKKNGETMYLIQRKDYEDGTWTSKLEKTFMEATNLSYYKAPQQTLNKKGCVSEIINQKKCNQTKVLFLNGKEDPDSHHLFISVKPKKGEGLGNSKRRTGKWMYEPWMLQKYEGERKGRKGSMKGVSN